MLNPVTAVVEGFKGSLLGINPPDLPVVLGSGAFVIALTVAGLFFFRRTERTIVDMF